MTLSQEQRAEISRQNSKCSTGPRSDSGKESSRRNALKHGLTATTVDPDVPGEPPGAYRAQLARWYDDLRPRNLLEQTMVERACRSSWKLDRCGRFEDAAITRRMLLGTPVVPGPRDEDQHTRAEHLGGILLL